MGTNSQIEWTTHSFNPWIGCTKAGKGCDHCYAQAWDRRWGGARWGKNAARTRTSPSNWRQPLTWQDKARKSGVRARVFCASLADVFDPHASISPAWRDDLGRLIEQTPDLDWLLLSKRIGRAEQVLRAVFAGALPPNLWLGATAVDDAEWRRDVPKLLALRQSLGLRGVFVSCEPMLGPIDPDFASQVLKHGGVDWLIVGGESGPEARPFDPDWARTLRDCCQTSFFFKQMGGKHKPFAPIPPDLDRREFPHFG